MCIFSYIIYLTVNIYGIHLNNYQFQSLFKYMIDTKNYNSVSVSLYCLFGVKFNEI